MAGYLYKYAELAGTPYNSQWEAAVIAYNNWVEARNTAHPDMDIAFVETDSFSTVLVTEMQQRGLKPGEDMLVIYAADGSAEICQAIKDGLVLCTGTNGPDPYAGGLIDIIHAIYEGDMSLEDANNLVSSFFLPTYVVSPENIDEAWHEGMSYAASLEPWEDKLLTIDEYNAQNAEN